MKEFELKFQVDATSRAAVEAAVGRGRSHRARLRARYYDTEDGALAARHVVLRVRKEDGAWIQTAKAPGELPVERLEHNVELAPVRAGQQPAPRIDRHHGTPVGERIAEALREAGHTDAGAEPVLVPLYGTDVWRTMREMRSGDALVELAFDLGEVHSGERAQPLCELEIELKHGSASAMLELARRWRGRYGLWLDTVSKSARGERLARGEAFGPPVKASAPRLAEGAGGTQIFRAVLDSCLAQMLPNASEIAAGSPDPEHVHQLRVGIRRLRTALRELAELAPAIDPGWEPVLADAFHALGQPRDRMNLQQAMQPRLEALGAPPVDFGVPDAAGASDARAVVRGAALQDVLLQLIVASVADGTALGTPLATEAAGPARKLIRARLARLHHQVLRDGRRFEDLDSEAQHRVRKRLKRLRYLGEFVAPLFGRRAAQRFIEALEPVQDALGEHNDAAMAMSLYRDIASTDGAAWFAVGWLSASHPASAARCRKALERMAEARPFWNKR
ncbi:CYTH and CHAD domain-containing protein [Variovorax sp. J22P168]|nr:CYTH and CHAD domain-containing protein [Variovorax sp. J22P168]